MIHFESIAFRNIGSYGDVAFEYDFRAAPITAFVGVNGSGKSTLLEALAFVLYGKSWRGVPKGELVNKKNRRGAWVEIKFTAPKGSFRVVRGIKPDVFEIWQDDKLLNQDSKSRDYQKTLESEILGLTWDSFNQVVVIGKASYVPFMKLKTETRRSFVEAILNLQVFKVMNDLRRVQSSAADKALLTAQTRLTSTQPRVDIATRNIENYKAMLADPSSVKLEDAKAAMEALTVELTESTRKGRELQYERENLVSNQRTVWLDVVAELEAVVAAKKASVEHLQAHATTLDADANAVRDFITSCRAEAARLRRQINGLDTRGVCPTCGGPIDASNVLKHSAELEAAEQEQLDMAKAAEPDLAAALAAIQAYHPTVLAAVNELAAANDDLNVMRRMDPANGHAQVTPELEDVDCRIAEEKAAFQGLQVRLAQARSDYDSAHRREVELANLMKQAEDDLAKASGEVAALEVEQATAARDVQVLGVVASILKDSGAKATIIRRYIPVINGIINELLASMGLFVKFELNEEFDDKILIRGFEEMTYNSLSEGEKLRIDMAVMMAWRELCILTGSSSTNLLVFDEIFDASFDEQGLEAFMQYIAERDDLNVVTMTHHPDRIDHFVSRTLRFRREDGYSVFDVET